MTGVDVLTTRECWDLLASHGVGRLAYTEEALPTISPVRFTVVGNHLLLRCRNERTAGLLDRQVVALEVDDVEGESSDSRSVVVVTGVASQVMPGEDAAESTHACPPRCEHRGTVRLEPGRVSGHRLHHVA